VTAGAAQTVSLAVQVIALVLFLGGAASFLMLLRGCFALRRLGRVSSRDDTLVLLKSAMVPQISVVYAAQDALLETRKAVRLLIDLHSANHEVVLALHGVTPEVLEEWRREFQLFETPRSVEARGVWEAQRPTRLVVLDLEPCSRAEALQTAVRASNGTFIGFIDPHAELNMEVLLRLLRPMLEQPDEVVACCGTAPPVPIASLAGRFAAIEMLRHWLTRGAAFASWNMVTPGPGWAVVVRRESLLNAAGAWERPMELVLNLHGQARTKRNNSKVAFLPHRVSTLPAAGDLKGLRELVRRDQTSIASAWRYAKQVSGGRRAIGWGLPALRANRLWRPLLETLGYVLAIGGFAAGLVGWRVLALFLLCTVATGMLVSMAAVILRELAEFQGSDPVELAGTFFSAIPENLGYRQLRNLWLIAGLWDKGD